LRSNLADLSQTVWATCITQVAQSMRVRTGVPGSGLGLAIVKIIAEQHQAPITLGDRHRGPGLVVFLTFPRV